MLSKGFTRPRLPKQYDRLLADISGLLEQARRTVARSLNAVLTSVYWQIGRRIVEHEQGGKARAEYGRELLVRLGEDLTKQHGRGFSWRNLYQMRLFYQGWEILQTPSAKFEARVICSTLSNKLSHPKFQTPSGKSEIAQTVSAQLANGLTHATFPLSWSHYAMGGIKAKVFASHYLTVLPDPEALRREIVTTQRAIEARRRPESV